MQKGNEDLLVHLTRFNKIAIQVKGPDDMSTRKPLAYRESNVFRLCVTSPHEICVNLVYKHSHAAAVTQSVHNLFHSFIVIRDNEYFLISNLH